MQIKGTQGNNRCLALYCFSYNIFKFTNQSFFLSSYGMYLKFYYMLKTNPYCLH